MNMTIDHIDHDPFNNRLNNLRLMTNAENAQNTRANAIYKFLLSKEEIIQLIKFGKLIKGYPTYAEVEISNVRL